MTMTMTSSQFGLEDMEDLLWGPSSPMADVMESLIFHSDKEEQRDGGGTSLEGDPSPASPLTSSSLSSSSSPPPFYSPPPSPPATLHGDKAETESGLLSLPWLGQPDPLRCSQAPSGDGKEDVLSDLDWMAERMDLSEFDWIDSYSPEESPSSPEDLLACLDCPMELGSLPLPPLLNLPSDPLPSEPLSPPPTVCSDPSIITVDEPESYIVSQEVPCSPPFVPEPQEELEIKSEPSSPDPSCPVVDSPSSPVYTLDLGSEVDVSETEVKPVVATVLPRIVLSLSPTRIVLVLAPKNEVGITTAPEVICCSPPASPTQRSSRNRPYPDPKASPSSPSATNVKVKPHRGAGGAERAALKAPKDKKVKKMEQNKTAATRYRQKKRAEQDALSSEYVMLERKNVELTEKAESMAREIEYLKELMEEVRMGRLKKGLSADP